MAEAEGVGPGWDSLPPELLRRVVTLLLTDWAYFPPEKASDCLQPIRGVCTAWRGIVDADIKQLALTVPSVRPACLAENFPNTTHLDLSRYHQHTQEVLDVLEQLKLKSLVLADPWQPQLQLPTQSMQHLTHLSFLADNLVLTNLASGFCEALVQLKQLEELQLSRLQAGAVVAQMLAHALSQLPKLNKLVLTGGAAPLHVPELYVLLNVDLPQLRTLEMMRLGVRMLPRSISRLTALSCLSFSGEMMRTVQLPDEVLQLTNLKVLDISANLAEMLPGCVLQLTRLQELHAGMNRLGMQAHNFAHMEELEMLVLASNKLLALHTSVWGLTTLKQLDLGHNNLSDLPAEISSLTGLTYLNVCHNFLTVLPAGLAYLTRLVELDISLNTDMRELPAGLGALSLLTRLNASHMRLKQLPTDIGGMVSLAHLDVSHNSLHHLAPQLSSLVALTHLEASDNKLHQSTAVPEELVALTALKVLCLARNRLQSLPEALGAFSALQVLDCSGNRLTSVPRVVGRCTALQQLLMSSNRLRGLTSGIGNLVRLQVLDLSHNQYRHLPTMTGDLTQLRELLLADNQLEDLPSSCSSLQKVTQLTLHSNRLHVLPPAICRMSGLQALTLHGNPLLGREAVVLHLQRQLPGLAIDGHSALEGAAVPAVPAGSARRFSSPEAFMRSLMTGLGHLPAYPQPYSVPPGFAYPPAYGNPSPAQANPLHAQGAVHGIAVAAAAAAQLPAQGRAPAVQLGSEGLGQWAMPQTAVEAAAANLATREEVYRAMGRLPNAVQAQLHLEDGPRAQQEAVERGVFGAYPAGTVPVAGQQPRAPCQLDAEGAGQAPTVQQQQHPLPMCIVDGKPVPWPFWQVPAAPQAAGPPAGAVPGAAVAGPGMPAAAMQAAADQPAGSSAAAAGTSRVPVTHSDTPGGSQAGGNTPWASSGSQPGMNLQQLLSGAGPSSDASSPNQAPPVRWIARPQPWEQQSAWALHQTQTQQPPLLRRYAREAALNLERAQCMDPSELAARSMAPPAAAAGPSSSSGVWGGPAAGTSRWREQLSMEGLSRLAPPGAQATQAEMVEWALQSASQAAPQQQAEMQQAAAAAAAAGAEVAAPAEDAMSTDSMHSAQAAGGAAPVAGATQSGAASQAAALPGPAGTEADAEEAPSSAPDTECASDTSSDIADGTQTPALGPEAAAGSCLPEFPPAVQRAVRGNGGSSSASGNSSAGGRGAASKDGASSSAGGSSSWGGSSSSSGGGAGAAGGRGGQAKPSRFQPEAEGIAAAREGCQDVASAAEQQGAPPAGGEDCRSAASGVADEEGAAAADPVQPVQEGRTNGYFPFSVMSSSWWGTG